MLMASFYVRPNCTFGGDLKTISLHVYFFFLFSCNSIDSIQLMCRRHLKFPQGLLAFALRNKTRAPALPRGSPKSKKIEEKRKKNTPQQNIPAS